MSVTETDQEIRSLGLEMMEKQAKLNELMRTRAPEPVKDYVLRGEGDAEVRLSEAFGDHEDLIVVHTTQ